MENLKEILQQPQVKNFLASNDINGFYEYLDEELDLGVEVSSFMQVWDECNVNVLQHMKGEVPNYFCYWMEIPECMLDDGTLRFPKAVYNIGNNAFEKAEIITCVDLRGITLVRDYAFAFVYELETVIIDPKVEFEEKVFYNCNNLKTLIIEGDINDYSYDNIVKWGHIKIFEEGFEIKTTDGRVISPEERHDWVYNNR